MRVATTGSTKMPPGLHEIEHHRRAGWEGIAGAGLNHTQGGAKRDTTTRPI